MNLVADGDNYTKVGFVLLGLVKLTPFM